MAVVQASTPKRRLADLLIEGGLETFVADRRAAKDSWRSIALDLYKVTAGELDITPESLRLWFPQYAKNDDESEAATA